MNAPGELIAGRYRLENLLGSGGMGVVWEAWDERLERRVALKQLHPARGLSPAEAELANSRAMREARINARLHHRYAVPVFDVAEHDGQPCLVMQFVPSIPLSELLGEGGPLAPAEAALVGAQVGSALAAAHAAGIVHRDVKPGNILIADDGSALISDFGISQALGDTTLTQAGLVHGTPAYLAPEVARGGAASPASDVFSLGATLYAALEGAPPFGTDPNAIALLHRVATGELDPPTRSGALTPVLLAMLATDPAARPTMAELAPRFAALSAAEPGVPSPTATTPVPVATTSPAVASSTVTSATVTGAPARRRRTVLIAVAVVLAVALVASLVSYEVFRPRTTTADPPAVAPVPGAVTATPTPTPTPTPTTATPAAPTSTTPTPSSPATPTPSPSSASPTAKADAPTAAELTRAVSTYYSLVPDDLDSAWPLLTASYQRSPSGGRASYGRFWAAISKVSVSEMSADPPDRVTATISYVYDDGRTSRERTQFRLVREGGTLKINGSSVGGG